MTERGPLPFTVLPHRSEALHSWLERLSAPYQLKPWQLLQELGFDSFADKNAQRQQPVQAFFDIVDLRRLAQLTRMDPSRLGLDRLCPPEWSLANDDWVMRCRDCEHEDRRDNIAPYERSVWRNAAHTFCKHHRTQLILRRGGWREEMTEYAENASPPLTDLESAIARQIRGFALDIAGALRGRSPVSAAGTLTASSFLSVAQDLLSFAVEIWQTERSRSVRTIHQQANEMNFHASTLFRHDTAPGRTIRCDGDPPIQLRHLADPAARRAALWLVLQVIWYVPSGAGRLALRLGDTPQDSFFGSVSHSGWAWLTERARSWPIRYRRRHWHGFVDDADNLKVQVTPLKG